MFQKFTEQLINLKGKSNKTKNIALTLQHINNEKKNPANLNLQNSIEIKKKCCGKKDLEIHGQKHNTLLSLHTLTL